MKDNFEELNKNWELKKDEIKNRIEYLILHPFPFEEYKNLPENYFDTPIKIDDNYNSSRNQKFEDSALNINTISELKYALDFLDYSEKEKERTLNHENAHGNQAEKVGAKHLGYKLYFLKDKDGRLGILPASEHSHKDNISNDEFLNFELSILEAPEIYGDKMSSNDKETRIKLFGKKIENMQNKVYEKLEKK